MSTKKVKMSSKGQVVIPADVRREMDLGKDSEFTLDVEGDHLVLTPVRDEDDWHTLRGCLDDLDDTAGELIARERRRELEREELPGGET